MYDQELFSQRNHEMLLEETDFIFYDIFCIEMYKFKYNINNKEEGMKLN